MIPRTVKFLILIHMCISLGGLLMHIKFHPVTKSLFFWWASPMSGFSLVVLPFLFCRASTVGWGYMLNLFAVVIGTIAMSFFSIFDLEPPITLYSIIFTTTLPNIIILWAKLPLAHLILREMRPKKSPGQRGCAE